MNGFVLLAHAPCTLLFCILLLFVTYSYYYCCHRWPAYMGVCLSGSLILYVILCTLYVWYLANKFSLSLTCSWSASRQKDSQIRRSQSSVCFSAGVSWKPGSIQLFYIGLSDFLRDLGRRISHISGDDTEVLFLFQRILVTIQRFNSVLLHDSFSIDRPDH